MADDKQMLKLREERELKRELDESATRKKKKIQFLNDLEELKKAKEFATTLDYGLKDINSKLNESSLFQADSPQKQVEEIKGFKVPTDLLKSHNLIKATNTLDQGNQIISN
jgi:hypothetical protein